MAAPRRRKQLQPARWTSDDEWMKQTTAAAAEAMAEWMKTHVHMDKTVRSLARIEMEHMAEAAVSAWIVRASHRMRETPDPVEREQLALLLL